MPIIDRVWYNSINRPIPGTSRIITEATMLVEGERPLGVSITSVCLQKPGAHSTTGYPIYPVAYPEARPFHLVGRYYSIPPSVILDLVSYLLVRQYDYSSVSELQFVLPRFEWCIANYNPLFTALYLPPKAKYLLHSQMVQLHPPNGVWQIRDLEV